MDFSITQEIIDRRTTPLFLNGTKNRYLLTQNAQIDADLWVNLRSNASKYLNNETSPSAIYRPFMLFNVLSY